MKDWKTYIVLFGVFSIAFLSHGLNAQNDICDSLRYRSFVEDLRKLSLREEIVFPFRSHEFQNEFSREYLEILIKKNLVGFSPNYNFTVKLGESEILFIASIISSEMIPYDYPGPESIRNQLGEQNRLNDEMASNRSCLLKNLESFSEAIFETPLPVILDFEYFKDIASEEALLASRSIGRDLNSGLSLDQFRRYTEDFLKSKGYQIHSNETNNIGFIFYTKPTKERDNKWIYERRKKVSVEWKQGPNSNLSKIEILSLIKRKKEIGQWKEEVEDERENDSALISQLLQSIRYAYE